MTCGTKGQNLRDDGIDGVVCRKSLSTAQSTELIWLRLGWKLGPLIGSGACLQWAPHTNPSWEQVVTPAGGEDIMSA